MKLPVSFDQNEWFVLISLIISTTIVIILPRRFPLSKIILLFLFSAVVARLSDHLLAGPNSNLYNLMDTNTLDLFDMLTYFLYMPFVYFFIYFYDKWKLRGYSIFLYIVGSVLAGTVYEWITSYFNVFNYHGWKVYYSFTVYLAIQPLTILFYELLRKNDAPIKYEQSKV